MIGMKAVMSNTGSDTVLRLSVLPGEWGLHMSKAAIVSPEDFWVSITLAKGSPAKRTRITREQRNLI